jgi:hypothetical protein
MLHDKDWIAGWHCNHPEKKFVVAPLLSISAIHRKFFYMVHRAVSKAYL